MKLILRLFFQGALSNPNIHIIGWIDISSLRFIELTKNCIGLIFPSYSEDQAGSVITCLHARLLPIVNYESGVDIHDFGIILKNCSIDKIKNSIKEISENSTNNLILRARKTWNLPEKSIQKKNFQNSIHILL
jgi:hypothetical protein